MKKFLSMIFVGAMFCGAFVLPGCGGGGGGGVTGAATETVPQIPADAQFAPPANFSSVAFPKQGPTANLTLDSFTAANEAYLYLVNYSASAQTVGYKVSGPSFAASKKVVSPSVAADKGQISPEHLFHLQLREKSRQMPVPVKVSDASRSSLRAAIAVGSTEVFKAYTGSSSSPSLATINAVCKRADAIAGTVKNVYFFVDDSDKDLANLDDLLNKLSANWATIYVKNREIFGEEPTGVLDNGLNVTDFYILLSRKIYTAGYFYTGDLSPVTTFAESNQKKMFNLQLPSGISTSVGTNNIDVVNRELSATMAHEFQHMIHYWRRGNISNVWLEESLSGYAEYANGFKIENGQNQSKALQSNKYFSLINSITFNKWHEGTDVSDVVNAYYGKVFLFGVWLAQNYGTNGSVQNLLAQKVNDKSAIEAFTGKTLEEIYAKFLMALSVNDSLNGGVYGIKDLNLTGTYSFGPGLLSVTLTGPAQSVVSAVNGGTDSFTMPSYTSRYIKINAGDGRAVNIEATLPSGTAVYQLRK